MTLDMDHPEPCSDGSSSNSNPGSGSNPSAAAAASNGATGALRTADCGRQNTQQLKLCVTTQQQPPSQHVAVQRNSLSPSVPPPRKIMSRNNNNTMFLTSYPSNLAELQLFRVMQNASLLLYYDTLLEMGGDDVQQLCDAGEEEFLEIMSLVGMASKPLHVRRLQKSLQEWVTNPVKFKVPLVPGEDFEIELSSPRVTSNHVFYAETVDAGRTIYSPSPGDVCALPPVTSPGLTFTNKRPYSPMDPACPPSSSSSPGPNVPSSVQLSPCLMDSQIAKLAAAAERLSKQLPQLEPKPHNAKKKVCKELELVISMSESDPRRMDEIRRYAAIYGRFDCKRKPEKPLTLHEVSVNEAAAQICRFVPALLTRRDELFPLARQVVKDSGCYYSKTQLSTVYVNKSIGINHDSRDGENSISARGSPRILDDREGSALKRQKLDSNSDGDDLRQDCDEGVVIRSSLHSLFLQSVKSQSNTRGTTSRRSSVGVEVDESDSQFTFSNSSSPQRKQEEPDDEDVNKYSPKVQVIAASGDNIIAVANPALAMSPAIIPPMTTIMEARECRTEVD